MAVCHVIGVIEDGKIEIFVDNEERYLERYILLQEDPDSMINFLVGEL